MTFPPKPRAVPARPYFSSGPCPKRPGWSANTVMTRAQLGRSHRAGPLKAQLKEAIETTREILGIPEDYRIGIVPASDTGAFEMAMWSMLGAAPVDVLAWESFGKGWATDAMKQLKLDDCRLIEAEYGHLPDLSQVRLEADVLFTWNGTTSGVRVPNADWISADRTGLTLCDATSAAFAQDLDWPKLDVTTFSWQKVLGGEAAHGMLILSPRAVQRLESYTPPWPLPKIFRLTKGGKLIDGIFEGATINTPSMWCVADYLDALKWAIAEGGMPRLRALADNNAYLVQSWIDTTEGVENLAVDPATRSNTSVCLKLTDHRVAVLPEAEQRAFVKRLTGKLDEAWAALDIGGYRDAPPGLRIWCGATVVGDDVEALIPWLDWAYADTLRELTPA